MLLHSHLSVAKTATLRPSHAFLWKLRMLLHSHLSVAKTATLRPSHAFLWKLRILPFASSGQAELRVKDE